MYFKLTQMIGIDWIKILQSLLNLMFPNQLKLKKVMIKGKMTKTFGGEI